MKKDEQYIDNLIKNYEIDITNDDVLLHGFFAPEDCSVEEKIQSILANGVKKRHNSLSILSTASLCRTERSMGEQIANYVSRGRFRVIIHIPQSLENIFFGNCIKAYGNAGNQYGQKCLLDFLRLDSIPTEFIVGVYYTDKEMYEIGEEINFTFVENSNYFNHKINREKNTKKLLEKIKKEMNKDSTYSFARNTMNLDEKYELNEWLDYCEKLKGFDNNSDYSEFAYQRQDHDLIKDLS